MNPYSYILEYKNKKMTLAMKALQEAAITLLQKKEVSEIDVKELCTKANVSRNTFYSYYNTVQDVIKEREDYLLNTLFELNLGVMDVKKTLPEDFLFYQETLDFMLENRKEFVLFSTVRADIEFINGWKTRIAYQLFERKRKEGKHISEMEMEIISGATVAGLIYFLSNPEKVSMAELSRLIARTLNNF